MGWFIPALIGLSTVASIDAERKATRRQRRANKLQQRIADVKASRERRRMIAEARVKRAQLANAAELTGVSESSGAIAGQGNIQSQAASNISFLDQVQTLNTQSNAFMQSAANASSNANAFSAIAGVATNVANQTGAWEKLFK